MVLVLVSSAQPEPQPKRKGRELNAPPTEGTAKRPCGEARQAAPEGRVLAAGLRI